MEVQYVGYTDKGKGKLIYLLQSINNGMKPILVKGKYGLQFPYVSETIFKEILQQYRIGDFIEVEFNQYGGISFK